MPIEITDKYIRVRIKLATEFQDNSFRTITISKTKGIKAVIGKLKGETKTSTQSYLFDKEKWTKDKAVKWVKDKGLTPKSFDLTDSLDLKALAYMELDEDYDLENTFIVREFNTFETKAKKEETRDGITIAGYLSTFKNIDRYGDIVRENAFDKTIKDIKRNRGGIMPILKDHINSVDRQIGSWNKFKVDDIGLYVEGFISKTPETEHTIRLIEDGHLNTLSMGGMFKMSQEKDKNYIEEVNLLEGSIVSIPANPKAQFNKKSLCNIAEKTILVEDNEFSSNKEPLSNEAKLQKINEILERK